MPHGQAGAQMRPPRGVLPGLAGWVKSASFQHRSPRIMANSPKFSFVENPPAQTGVLVVLTDDSLRFGPAAGKAVAPAKDLISRAAKADGFKGKKNKLLELIGLYGLKADRLIVA